MRRSGNVTPRGDYTLSFRSTEFADDNEGGGWPRDGVAGADGEMAAYGFALAQIVDMEAWFRELRGGRVTRTTKGVGLAWSVWGEEERRGKCECTAR